MALPFAPRACVERRVLVYSVSVLLLAILGNVRVVEGIRRLPSDISRNGPPVAAFDSEATDEQNRRQTRRHLITSRTEASVHKRKRESNNDGSNKQQQQLQQEPDRVLHKEHMQVTSLPLLDTSSFPSAHYAGHVQAGPDPDDKKIFYWLFAPDDGSGNSDSLAKLAADPNVPLIIWLNGGPGCSSMDGLFLENGPFRLVQTDDGSGWSILTNPFSWHTIPAWVVYVDQPVGTGLSFTTKKTYCKNDKEINADFHYFLTEFLKIFGDDFLIEDPNHNGAFVLNRKLFFSGESHAGHYIPSMMAYILDRNDDSEETPEVLIPISGAAVGNGWVDPYNQYAAAEAAYGAGLIDLAQKAKFDKDEERCQKEMDNGNLDASVCFRLLDDIVAQSHGQQSPYKVSQYDVSKWEKKKQARVFPPGHKDVESYLGGWDKSSPKIGVDYKSVLEAIHASSSIDANQRYQECTDPPFDALKHQDGLGVIPEIIQTLDHRTKPVLLFFNGMDDLICNHVGNERFLDVMPWQKAHEWMLAERFVWKGPIRRNGTSPPAGYVKQHENLIFLKVPNSGHMVPMDQPEISLEMMRVLVLGGSFLDSNQNLGRSDPRDDSCEPCPSCPQLPPLPSPVANNPPQITEDNSMVATGADVFSGNITSEDSSWSQDLITGALVGAFVAFFVVGCFSLIRRRRAKQRARLMVLNEEENEEFDLHLEMHSSAKFRDSPPETNSTHSGGSSRRSSRSSRDII